jgi:rubredoxin---NAD+ reductase
MAHSRAAGVVIIGSGLAGYTLAREFRKHDRETPVTLITADGGEVYSKPMLSNAFAQKKTAHDLISKQGSAAAEELGAVVHTRHRVTRIDRAARMIEVTGEDGSARAIGYDRLVLAIGADPRPYRVEGSDLIPVASVNDIDAYAAWHGRLKPGERVLLIGAGLIGSEFANDLLTGGLQVTIVDPMAWPLGRLVPEAVGLALATALREAGATMHLGRSVARLQAAGAQGGAIAVLDDGSEVGFDHALSAIGLVPRTALAQAAGLEIGQGIIVDALLRTSDTRIYALGDCAQTAIGTLPFVLPLMAQARALAATLAGTPTPLKLPALPVGVKTPALPVVVCPPAAGSQGAWVIEGEGRDLKALFLEPSGRAIGFALTGARASERQALVRDMPALIA